MSTQFTNRQWRLPNNENKDKQSNYSMDFDGGSNIDTNLDSGSYSSFTISAWIKADTLSSGKVVAAQTRYGNWSNSSWLLYVEAPGGVPYMTFYMMSGGSPILAGKNTVLSINQWYHIVATWDGTTSKVYIDGVKETTEGTVSSMNTSVVNTLIGASHDSAGTGTTGGWDGKLDAVSIFDYALSASQVTTLYGSSSTGIGNPMSLSPKPVASYNLGDKSAFNGSNYLVPNSSLKDYVMDFDGSDRINCGTSSLGITNAITVSAWVKIPLTTSNSVQPIVCERDTTIGNNWSLRYRGGSYNKYYFAAWNTNGSAVSAPSSGITPNVNEWQHVVGVYNGSSTGRSYVYVNGVLRGTSQPPTGSGINSISSIAPSIGGYQDLSVFVGSISNVQVFNTELPLTGTNSIQTLYNNGSPLSSMSGFTSLVSWWKLDASDTYDSSTGNWTIEDHAGSNDGTSSGMTQANLVAK